MEQLALRMSVQIKVVIMQKNQSLLTIVFVLLLTVPMLITYWLSAKDRSYDEILRLYECQDNICNADFDGDGMLGQLIVEEAPPSSYDSWLVVIDSGRELLRLPHRRVDNTLRTHVAVRYETGNARLIVYDHIRGQNPPLNAVFAWNGRDMAQIFPSESDDEILTAMAARDDTGSQSYWAFYRAFWTLALICYYIPLIILIAWQYPRSKLR